MLERLRGDDLVVVIATDKTNAYEVVNKRDYMWWVRGHLDRSARKMSFDALSNIFKEGFALALAKRSSFSRSEFNNVVRFLEL